MNAEFDHELTPDQWETLKALRGPVREGRRPNGFIVGQLVALGLAVISDSAAQITPDGRKVLIRGSSRLLDVAA
ncbi:conserved protein of unknown function [Bradyrhizobium sp. ORS 285]|uniref:hypothetical protein n=1 Tax=Bradyrhizobium sp. ORS 285 TaxID=115808 RepID=UPI0002407828|nr:hypothetical protein [Bradyrhizobium sp. ORS 285]CCD84399.1 conserved hypothetical protein [Bradyrhizobium sp. ORS 285]SMX57042.1 conserved protein of unknown function [Bradyrhizobium sp. ORS 285]